MADGGINLGETVGGGGLLLAIGAGLMKAFDGWLKSRRTPEQKVRDQLDLDQIAVTMAGELMQGMRADLDALRGAMAAQDKKIETLGSSHADCERRCEDLTGEIRKLQAVNEAQARLYAQLQDPAATNIGGSVEGAIFELKDGAIKDVSGRPTPKETK